MGFGLERAQEGDILRLIEIRFLNARHDPYENIMFPTSLPPEARTATFERFRSAILEDLESTVLKVIDEESQKLVAFAIWAIQKEAKPESSVAGWKRSWDDGTNQQAADEFVTAIVTKKQRWMAGKPHCYLDLLEVDPSWQRRGAGKLLLQWGLDQATTLGLPCYLESTPAGLGLYKSRGFEEKDVIDLDMARWGLRGVSRYVCLERSP